MRESEFARAELRARVVTAWLDGLSVREINARLGVSPYRLNRIVHSTAGLPEERSRREEERAHRAADEALAQEAALQVTVMEWSRDHVGDPLMEGAASLGRSVRQLRRLLGTRAALHPPPRLSTPRYTDEQILDHVRAWVDANGMSGVDYRAAAREHRWPSMATVTARFGSWRRALLKAGFATESASGGRPLRWTDDKLRAVVNRYFTETADHWSAGGLRDWLDADPEHPSFSLVRKRLGPWPKLVKLADPDLLLQR